MHHSPTVTAADIARVAGVGRAAVSNWRRRFDDFPSPVGGTSSSPLFSLEDVGEWLRRQGKLAEVPLDERVWQQVRAGVEDLQLAEVVGHLGAFLLFLDRSPAKWKQVARRGDVEISSQEFTAEYLPGTSSVTIELSLLRAVAELAERRGAQATFDFLHARYLEAHSRRVAVLPPEVAGLMADLAAAEGGTILDPACGVGNLLLATAAAGATRLLGQDRDEAAARIAAVRLLLHGHEASLRAGDSLREDRFGSSFASAFGSLQADAVVCGPPFGERSWGYEELAGDVRWEYGVPPRGEPELPWVQHGLFHVRPGGHVVVLMPAAAADRRSGRRIRARLLRTGALRAVIALPAGAAPNALGAPHLWILRRPQAGDPVPSRILMMDVTELPWTQLRETVLERWRDFHSSAEVDGIVPLIDLLDEDLDLTPGRHAGRRSGGSSGPGFMTSLDAVGSSANALQRALEDLRTFRTFDRDGLPTLRAGGGGELSRTTIAEQARAGALGVHQAPRSEPVSGNIPMLTVEDVIAGRAPTGRVSTAPDMVVVEPGDVVFPLGGRAFAARVVHEGGAVLGPGLLLLRVDPERVDPVCLAGFLRIAGDQASDRGHTATSRSEIRRVEIPRLPLEEQRRLGEAFQRLQAVEETVNQVTNQASALVKAGLAALGNGTLGAP
ncbi:N-6 DNA methylase [Sphaerisporangium perillae]|uniref:N-6 DNA methylase n=1 Tax=Sphaerisporangium perillae TaxID=2935860 RepID=UPI00200E4C3F|nr:N-6 DNA methylase [Sphaerisporangium perillae]